MISEPVTLTLLDIPGGTGGTKGAGFLMFDPTDPTYFMILFKEMYTVPIRILYKFIPSARYSAFVDELTLIQARSDEFAFDTADFMAFLVAIEMEAPRFTFTEEGASANDPTFVFSSTEPNCVRVETPGRTFLIPINTLNTSLATAEAAGNTKSVIVRDNDRIVMSTKLIRDILSHASNV